MLSDLQEHLSSIYKVEPGYDVKDFLVTDPTLAKILGGDALIRNSDETLLLAEDDEGMALSVYLDSQMLGRLGRDNPMQTLKASCLNDLWTVLEGISHFNYLVWSAGQDRSVTLLELEMQAEVDKFISTWLMAQDQVDCEFADRVGFVVLVALSDSFRRRRFSARFIVAHIPRQLPVDDNLTR